MNFKKAFVKFCQSSLLKAKKEKHPQQCEDFVANLCLTSPQIKPAFAKKASMSARRDGIIKKKILSNVKAPSKECITLHRSLKLVKCFINAYKNQYFSSQH